MQTKPELKKVSPEEVDFVPGKFYYVKRRGSKKVEGLQCIATKTKQLSRGTNLNWASAVAVTRQVAVGPGGFYSRIYLDTDIEYVLQGVPDEILHLANRKVVWGE